MQLYQKKFIELCLNYQLLRFGEFTLKSGRVSPYFFNAGLLNTGSALLSIGRHYAETLVKSTLTFDMLFGPAYKGIPLVTATAIALAHEFDINCPYAFNRKEVKDHGEGGLIVGHALQGRVLIIDDVITAGTAIEHSLALINAAAATPCGIVVALDRQERGSGANSAIEEIMGTYAIPVVSIIKLEHLIEFVHHHAEYARHLPALVAYQARWGVH